MQEIVSRWETIADAKLTECNEAIRANNAEQNALLKAINPQDFYSHDRSVRNRVDAQIRGPQAQLGVERKELCKKQEIYRDSLRVCQIMREALERGLGEKHLVVCQNDAEEICGLAVYERDFEPINERGESLGKHLKISLIATNPDLLFRVKGIGTAILKEFGKIVIESEDLAGCYGVTTYSSRSFYDRFGVSSLPNIINEQDRGETSLRITREEIERRLSFENK